MTKKQAKLLTKKGPLDSRQSKQSMQQSQQSLQDLKQSRQTINWNNISKIEP